MFSRHKKFIVSLVIVALLAPSIFTASPQKAHALASGSLVFTSEVAEIPFNVHETLDGVLWVLINTFIQATTASIIEWINSGFDGDPFFVTNPGDYFEDVLIETTGVFIYELGLEDSPLCTGFRTPVIQALVPQPYKVSAQCTIEDVIGNIEGFTAGNWEEGGWAGWIELTQRPQNNPYGAYLLADEELRRRQLEQQEQRRQELAEGSGFLTFRRCVARAPTTLEGEVITEIEEVEAGTGRNAVGEGPCIRYETDTPGGAIAEQLNVQIGAGTERRLVADEWNEALGAIIDALINQFMLQGLRALSGDEERGIEPYFAETFEEDKQKLLDEIDKAIEKEQKRLDASSDLQETLLLINETKACYEEQKSIVQDGAYNPPPNTGPSVKEIDDSIDELEEKRQDALAAGGSTSSSQASGDIGALEELRSRVEAAETYAELAELWAEFRELKNEIEGSEDEEKAVQRASDDQAIAQAESEKESLQRELDQCKATNEKLGQYVGRRTPTEIQEPIDVECTSGCETTVIIDGDS